jgi:hypothetical protein
VGEHSRLHVFYSRLLRLVARTCQSDQRAAYTFDRRSVAKIGAKEAKGLF